MILDLFDQAYLISLPDEWARRIRSLKRLNSIGIGPVWVEGYKPSEPGPFKDVGTRGCFESHRRVIDESRLRGHASVLIAEDDVTLAPDFLDRWKEARPIIAAAEWDLLYFYTRKTWEVVELGDFNTTVIRTKGEVGLHLYAVHSRFFDRYLSLLAEGEGRPVDMVLHDSGATILAIHPVLAGQEAGPSGITGTWRPARFLPHHVDVDGPWSGWERVCRERQRQIEGEGFKPEQDDRYKCDELARAAACYEREPVGTIGAGLPKGWPWRGSEGCWWKPGPTKERMMEKAGALYLAQAEWFQRQVKRAVGADLIGALLREHDQMMAKAKRVAALLDKPV